MKLFLVCCGLATIVFANVADAKPYVSAKIGVADFIIDTNQYMYWSPNSYKSTIVDAKIDDINAIYHVAVGYNFGDVRIDAEYGYGKYVMSGNWSLNGENPIASSSVYPWFLSYPATYSLKNRVNTFTANLHYNVFNFGQKYRNNLYTDINIPLSISRNSIYVTGSLGMAHIADTASVFVDTAKVWPDDTPYSTSMGASHDRFMYGVGAGLELAIKCDLYADFSYKYTNLGKYHQDTTKRDYSMHEIVVGLRYEF